MKKVDVVLRMACEMDGCPRPHCLPETGYASLPLMMVTTNSVGGCRAGAGGRRERAS
jgi:hypothetical protein